MSATSGQAATPEHLSSLVAVLGLLRNRQAATRPELVRASGLGRALVNQRVSDAIELGLAVEGPLAPSTGGRAPRQIHFCCDAGYVLLAELGATGIAVAASDLCGDLLLRHTESADIADGPEPMLERLEALLDELIQKLPSGTGGAAPSVWGIGVGVPGPVEFATGRPISPPIMPGWDEYPVRARLADRYSAPVFVDNDVNLMALGESAQGSAFGIDDFIYVKIGTGIGAGLVSGGRLHRGAQGCAGDVGHVPALSEATDICRCGKVGCLEALAGGFALARDGLTAAKEGRSPYLRDLWESTGQLTAADVSRGAHHGDAVSVQLLDRSARLVGMALAGLVNFFNPSLVVVGGGVAESGDQYLAAIRRVVYERSLPLATRDLVITRSNSVAHVGLSGAASMVLDELFSNARIGRWVDNRSSAGRPEVAD